MQDDVAPCFGGSCCLSFSEHDQESRVYRLVLVFLRIVTRVVQGHEHA